MDHPSASPSQALAGGNRVRRDRATYREAERAVSFNYTVAVAERHEAGVGVGNANGAE